MKRYIKSSINIPDDIADIIGYVFEDYYQNDYDIPDFDVMQYDYDVDDESTYNRIVKFFEDLDKKIENKEIKIYDGYLQLSDRRIFNEFDDEYVITDEYASIVVDMFVDSFTEQTGVEVYLLGRSGRHICIPFTLDNIIKYDELKKEWENCEDGFLDFINNGL